jgi:anti-sigma factor RsiW
MRRGVRTCKDIVDLLSAYMDEDLSGEARRELDRHMAACPPCIRFLESLKETRAHVRALRCEEIPPEVQALLRKFLVREARGRPS